MYLRKTDKHKFDSFTGTFWNKEKAHVFFEAFDIVKSSQRFSHYLDNLSVRHFVKILQEGTLGRPLYKSKNSREREIAYGRDHLDIPDLLISDLSLSLLFAVA